MIQKNSINRIIRPTNNYYWEATVKTIKDASDIKSNICVGCGKGAICDKNNVRYMVSWKMKPDEINELINIIRNTK